MNVLKLECSTTKGDDITIGLGSQHTSLNITVAESADSSAVELSPASVKELVSSLTAWLTERGETQVTPDHQVSANPHEASAAPVDNSGLSTQDIKFIQQMMNRRTASLEQRLTELIEQSRRAAPVETSGLSHPAHKTFCQLMEEVMDRVHGEGANVGANFESPVGDKPYFFRGTFNRPSCV